jgi:hypothetical protein
MNHIVTYRPVAWQLLGKHIPVRANACSNRMSFARKQTSKHIPVGANACNNRMSFARKQTSKQTFSKIESLCLLRGPCRGVIKGHGRSGGGVEYLHHDPASRRRRRNGKSQI